MVKWGYRMVMTSLSRQNLGTVRFRLRNYIVVYVRAFELGLWFPLHPFIRELLDFLNITIAELYPNAWGCVTTILILCKVFRVRPSLIEELLSAFEISLKISKCKFLHDPVYRVI